VLRIALGARGARLPTKISDDASAQSDPLARGDVGAPCEEPSGRMMANGDLRRSKVVENVLQRAVSIL